MAQLNAQLRRQGIAPAGADAVAVRMGIHGALSAISHMAVASGKSMPVAQGEALGPPSQHSRCCQSVWRRRGRFGTVATQDEVWDSLQSCIRGTLRMIPKHGQV